MTPEPRQLILKRESSLEEQLDEGYDFQRDWNTPQEFPRGDIQDILKHHNTEESTRISARTSVFPYH